MIDIDDLINQAENAMNKMERKAQNMAKEEGRSRQKSYDIINKASSDALQISGGLERSGEKLEHLRDVVAGQISETAALGKRLEDLFRTITELLNDIDNEKESNKDIDEKILKETENTSIAIKNMNITFTNATASHNKTVSDTIRTHNILNEMNGRLNTLAEAQSQVYIVIKELQSAGFRTINQNMNDTRLEATLADDKDRLVKVQLTAKKKAEELKELALDLDMTDVDEVSAAKVEEKIRKKIEKLQSGKKPIAESEKENEPKIRINP